MVGPVPNPLRPSRLQRNALHGAEVGGLAAILLLAGVGAACAVTLIGLTTLALLTAACLAAGAVAGLAINGATRAWAALSRTRSP